MKNNDRLHAVKILTTLLERKSALLHLMAATSDTSPMTKELCFGVCRHYYRLHAIADLLVKKRPKATEVWVVLLMGIYQIQYMDAPDYAAVKETVAVLDKLKMVWAKALVNAVLRTYCREKEDILSKVKSNRAFIHGQPQWFLERIQNDWPRDWERIAAANDAHPPMTLRVNIQKNTVEEYLLKLTTAGIDARRHDVAPEGITLFSPVDVHSLPGFTEGCVSVQDGAAQGAASLLSLAPGLRVLDACCAPGGKTGHILESEPHLAACVALDVDANRLQRVEDNLNRLHLKAELIKGDALHPESWWDGIPFDRILVDAPCSALGVIRRHSDIKLLRTPEDIAAVTKVQKAMLHALWPLLAPGGVMVYATCSIIAEENELQIADFAAAQPQCQVLPIQQAWGRATGHGRQILPGDQGMDGFFYSVLRKG